MDALGGVSLFRPTPLTRTQATLAGFYGKTSEFVQEQFESIRSQTREGGPQGLNPTTETGIDEQRTAIRPEGVGELLDIFI